MRFFDIPSKLLSLYSAFIYYFKKALQTDDKEYEFLICPGTNCIVEVEEIFERTTDKCRLFLIEIPEKQFYSPKTMMVILGHEIAHFVGTDIRNRRNRQDNILKICAHVIAHGMKCYILKYDIFDSQVVKNVLWDDLEENINKWLRGYMGEYITAANLEKWFDRQLLECDEEGVERHQRFMKKYLGHSEVLSKVLLSSIEDMLKRYGLEIFSFVVHKGFEIELNRGKVNYEQEDAYTAEKMRDLDACFYAVLGSIGEDASELNVRNELDRIFYFFKECYADMLCILMLELSLEDYLQTFIVNLDDAAIALEDLENSGIVARIALVMMAMSSAKDDSIGNSRYKPYIWTTEEQFKNFEEKDLAVQKLKDYATKFCYAYIKKPREYIDADMVSKERNIIYDGKFLHEILNYLLACRNKYYMANKNENDYKKMKNIFHLFEKKEKGDCFSEIIHILKGYESDIYADTVRIMDGYEDT